MKGIDWINCFYNVFPKSKTLWFDISHNNVLKISRAHDQLMQNANLNTVVDAKNSIGLIRHHKDIGML